MDEGVIGAIVKFSEKKVAVVGDAILDNYSFGKLRGSNPDKEGKPLLAVKREENTLGGALNVAFNVSSLNGDCCFYGVIGNDNFGNLIEKICSNVGVKYFFIKDGETLVKKRFIDQEEGYMIRVDYGESLLADISEDAKNKILNDLFSKEFDVIILSDYNKRVFKGDLAERIIRMAKDKGIKVIADPKPANMSKFQGAYAICPNLKEAREIIGNEGDCDSLAKKIKEKFDLENVIITLSEEGAAFWDGSSFGKNPSYADKVVDVMGAGDSFVAALALGVAAGVNIDCAVKIANLASACVVEKEGTSVCRLSDVVKKINAVG